MKTFMYAFVKGTDEAVSFYKEAFNASVEYDEIDLLEDGTYMHVELKFDGQMLGLSEQSENNPDSIKGKHSAGNIMQFIIEYDSNEEEKIRQAYKILSKGATIYTPLSKLEYADLLCDLTDQFGMRWCLAIKNLNNKE